VFTKTILEEYRNKH